MYTLLQIALTAGIFAVTFTPAAPVFPIIIVLLVPLRLRIMSRHWAPGTLKGWHLPHRVGVSGAELTALFRG